MVRALTLTLTLTLALLTGCEFPQRYGNLWGENSHPVKWRVLVQDPTTGEMFSHRIIQRGRMLIWKGEEGVRRRGDGKVYWHFPESEATFHLYLDVTHVGPYGTVSHDVQRATGTLMFEGQFKTYDVFVKRSKVMKEEDKTE